MEPSFFWNRIQESELIIKKQVGWAQTSKTQLEVNKLGGCEPNPKPTAVFSARKIQLKEPEHNMLFVPTIGPYIAH